MTTPDSGEREVCGVVMARMNGDDVLTCDQQRGHVGAHTAMVAEATAVREFPADADGVCRTKHVLLPLPLAQRILAALELNAMAAGTTEERALAFDLRAAVERKP